MTREDQLDIVRIAWRLREPTESADEFDSRVAPSIEAGKKTVGRLRAKLGLAFPARTTRPHVLRERAER